MTGGEGVKGLFGNFAKNTLQFYIFLVYFDNVNQQQAKNYTKGTRILFSMRILYKVYQKNLL